MTTLHVDKLAGRQLRQVTTRLAPGLHVLLTLDAIGVGELIPLLDGSTAPRHGSVHVDARRPFTDPELRKHIGSLWATEHLPRAPTVQRSLESLGFDSSSCEAIAARLDQLGQPGLFSRPPDALDARALRTVALAVALAKSEPQLLLLSEPFAAVDKSHTGPLLELLTKQATTIPILVVTASRNTAARLSGPSAELGGGFWRHVPQSSEGTFTLRVAGANLRPLAAEIVRRPRVHSLRMNAHAEGHEEIWFETSDPASLSLDLVRVTQQLGLHVWSIDTLAGAR